MKIPFNIKYRQQVESGEYKVETRDGKPARVICWDRTLKIGNDLYPISALVKLGENEQCFCYTLKGIGACRNSPDALILITPEPELSEFEKKLSDVVGYAISLSVAEPKKPTNEFVKEYAAELLALARKEITPSFGKEYETGYLDGMEDALKDLPRWREWEGGACGNSDGHPIALVSGVGGIRFTSVLGATGQKYIMLDDLKKLPGFND